MNGLVSTHGLWRKHRPAAGVTLRPGSESLHRSRGIARTGVLCAAVCFVWIEAGRDVLLTQHMIQVQDDCGETNPVARAMTWSFGPAALLPFKLGALLVFTAALAVLLHRNRPAAELLASFGVIISAGLATWWDWIVVSWVQQLVGFQ